MSNLVRTLIVAGLIAGTQPFTLMGLLIVVSGQHPRRNGWAFVGGVFAVETLLILLAAFFLNDTVSPDSEPGRVLLWIRVGLGVVLVVGGLLLRRPPKEPPPETPKALEKLRGLSAPKAFIGGVLVADYVGPVIGSLAIATSNVTGFDRLLAISLFLVIAIGIPVTVLLISTTSDRANRKLNDSTRWVMVHRRQLASWIGIVMGVLLIADGTTGLLLL